MCLYDNQGAACISSGQFDIENQSADIDNGLYQSAGKASSGRNTGAARLDDRRSLQRKIFPKKFSARAVCTSPRRLSRRPPRIRAVVRTRNLGWSWAGAGPGDTAGLPAGRCPQERPGLAAWTLMLHFRGFGVEKKQDFCRHARERPV